MSRKFLTNLDLGKNQLIQAAVENLSGAPSTPVKGQLYMNTTDNTLYWWDGAQWIAAKAAAGATPAGTVTTSAVADSAVVGVSTNFAREDHKHAREAFGAITAQTSFGAASNNGAATTVTRSDHTHGTPTHDGAAHSAISHSALAAPTADISWGGFKLTNVGTPATGTDATTKDYVDNLAAGLSWKEAVRAASTANVVLVSAVENGDSLDGVTLVTGDRILLKNQSTGSENGIYTVNASGAPTRANDANAVGELEGAAVFVIQGSTNFSTAWVNTTSGAVTPGTTATTWAQFGAGTAYQAGNGLFLTGSVIDVVGDTSIVVTADLVTRGALTGDVTAAQSSNATTIANNAVDNVKAADMPANTFKGNNTGSSADPQDVTVAAMQTALAIPAIPVTVPNGGTGRITSTTAYALLAAGTTATGAHQTLASAGATTDLLVGGGASALPVWTAATGSGAPVRATSPALVTPNIGTPSAGVLTSCTGLPTTGLVNNAVTNAKAAQMVAHTFKGNNTASTADPKDLTIAELQAELAVPTTVTLDATYLKRVAQDCAANVLTTVTHNFNTRDVTVTVYRNSTPWDDVDVDVERSSVNTVEVRFATAPAAGAFRIVVQGLDQ